MNVSANMIEPSEAPVNSLGDTGDLLDRMRGNSGTHRNNADAFPDLKKLGSLSSESQNPLKKLVDKPVFPSKAKAKTLEDTEDIEEPDEDVDEETMEESNPADGTEGPKKKRARKKWKKPKDKPNRPLSAYNLFFQAERASMLGNDAMAHDQDKAKKRVHRKTHGKVGFAEMARVIGQKWKQLPEDKRAPFMEQAAKEKTRYATELQAWKDLQKLKLKASKLKAKESQSWGMEGSSSNMDDESGLRRMMQDGAARHQLSLLQAQQADNDYIRALQERQLAILTGRSSLDTNAFQYPSAAEASANAILQQFQSSMGGGSGGLSRSGFSGSGLAGFNAMNVNSGFPGMGINSMNMNSMNQVGMNMMDLQPMGNMTRQSALGASENRLQQLRASAGLSDMGGFGQTTGMGMGSTNSSAGFGSNQQGDLGRIQQLSQQFQGGNEMAAAMARRYQNRFSM